MSRSEPIPDGKTAIFTKPTTSRDGRGAKGYGRATLRALSDQAGTAVVEFALVLPLFLVLVLGMVDFGKGLNYWINETHLANQGARFAVVNNNPGEAAGDTLQQYIREAAFSDELEDGGTNAVEDPLAVCIEFPEGEPAAAGDPVTVRVMTTYDWLPFLDANLGVSGITITGSATMRLEATPTEYATADNSEDCS